MDYVILGSSGLLGQTLLKIGKKRNLSIIGLSRNTKKFQIDFLSIPNLLHILRKIKPKVIINAAGIVNIDFCEEYYTDAFKVNALPLKHLSEFCSEHNIKLLQISTDHFFTGDKNKKHKENDKITILNNYAKTKFLAEQYTKSHDSHIIIRTNFIGCRNKSLKPTFLEWVLDSFKKKKELHLFNDFYCSIIDVNSLSNIIYDLANTNFKGLINIGSKDVFTKKVFVEKLAKILKLNKKLIFNSSVKKLKTRRAESLGLDVKKIEKILKYKMPNINQVCNNLIKDIKK
tara:strand:+ start:247 stop:1107 length:861 start_codon:yes stop_codon:yes gene_type:complete